MCKNNNNKKNFQFLLIYFIGKNRDNKNIYAVAFAPAGAAPLAPGAPAGFYFKF